MDEIKKITSLEDVEKLAMVELHCHTDGSNGDSTEKTKDMIAGAAKKGFKAIAITNHGTLTETEIARAAEEKYGIKVIYGVEAYYQKVFGEGKKNHLILMAKNRQGYQAICKAVSKSNNPEHIDRVGAPIMVHEDLVEYFGEGGIGHGNVIATSACVAGILANIIFRNGYVDEQIEKLQKKMAELPSPADADYLSLVEGIEKDAAKLEALTSHYNSVQELSKKSYRALKSKAQKAGDTEELERLTTQEALTEQAKKDVLKLRKEKTDFQKALTVKKQKQKALEDKHTKWNELNEQIKTLNASKKPEVELIAEAKEVLGEFKKIFGENNFYIELQNHGMYDELVAYSKLAQIARETGTPVVAANDAHMLNGDESSIRARKIIRTLRFNKTEPIQDSDRELYVKTPKEIAEALSDFLSEDIVIEALNNTIVIADQCNVEFPEDEKHYPVWQCVEGKTDKEELEELARKGIEWRYGKEWTPQHEKRLKYELGVIDTLGFNSYILIVQDFLNYARMLGQLKVLPKTAPTMEELIAMPKDFPTGVGVGPGRGSAVGSIVCYLTGITAIDPIKYNLIFERFLNVERVTMPDIDSDFRSDIRELVIDYCANKYGQHAVCGIMARSTLQAKAAIKSAARALGVERGGDTTTFSTEADALVQLIDKETLVEIEEEVKSKFAKNAVALQIFEDAKLIEGTFVAVTKHAAGVCISDSDITDVAPLIYVKGKDAFCTQYDKKYVENVGIIKMDFLGLTNLSFLDKCARYVQKSTGDTFNVEKLPQEKVIFEKIFQKGKTNAVFQFESGGMKQMIQDFKPESLEDLILLVAAYRPGPLQFLESVIAVKKGTKKPEYVIPEMESVLGTTYGYPIYQEQIMEIFNKFAGFSLGESDIIRRYMSKKETEKFAVYKDKFIDGLTAKGAKKEKAEEFWKQLLEFSHYAFNKSHAAAYAYVAYITAWLKYHYPKEFFCAVMNYTSSEKIISVFGDCRDRGIKVAQPHINYSVDDFSINGNSIIFGFSAVKNCGVVGELIQAERRANGPYRDFVDFLVRTRAKKDAVKSLILAGAFDSFVRNRNGLASVLDDYYAILSKIKIKEDVIYKEPKAGEKPKTAAQKETAMAKIEELKKSLYDIRFVNSEENKSERLNREREFLGSFISASPLDGYKMPDELGFTPISNLEGCKKGSTVSIMGFISEIEKKNRKSDGAEMAFFKLEDATGIVKVNCFTKPYAKFKNLIVEGKVVKATGYVQIETYNDEQYVKFNVNEMEFLPLEKDNIVINIKDRTHWPKVQERIKPFLKENGHPLMVYDLLEQQFYRTPFLVSDDIETVDFAQ